MRMHHDARRAGQRILRAGVLCCGGLLLLGCSVTEGHVSFVSGPPRVAEVNSPVRPQKVLEGEVRYEEEADCFVIYDDNQSYAVAWNTGAEGDISGDTAVVRLDSGLTIKDGDRVILGGELDLPDSDQAAKLPDLPTECGAEEGGWFLVADADVQ